MDSSDIYTQAYFKYTNILKNTMRGQQVLERIENDHRAKSLNGQNINIGNASIRYDPSNLALWYLWASDKFGEDEANNGLESYLDSNITPILSVIWVLGIEVENTISLSSGVKIIPIDQMPESLEKERFLENSTEGILSLYAQKPNAAIVRETFVQRTSMPTENIKNKIDKDKDYWETNHLLTDTVLVLNAIENISCIPFFSTSYYLPKMPFGFFNGTYGGNSVFDVTGRSSTKLDSKKGPKIIKLLDSFTRLRKKKKERYRIILSRLSQSKRKFQIEDKILDLSIALEMALITDNLNNDQLSLTFRLRGSWLVAKNYQDRCEVYEKLKQLYNYRGQIAHSGKFENNSAEHISDLSSDFSIYCNIAERIIYKLICDGQPDWTKLVLGADKPG